MASHQRRAVGQFLETAGLQAHVAEKLAFAWDPRTCGSYLRVWKRFQRWAIDQGVNLNDFQDNDLASYLAHQQNVFAWKPSTQTTQANTIRTLRAALTTPTTLLTKAQHSITPQERKPSDLIVYHPSIVGKPVKEWGDPLSLSPKQCIDYTIVALRLSGLRSADISKILFRSIVVEEQSVVFSIKDLKQAKGDAKWRVPDKSDPAGSLSQISLAVESKESDIPCPVQALAAYIAKRPQDIDATCPFLFVCAKRREVFNMSTATIASRYNKVARSIGIPESFTAHDARSAAAASCLLNTRDMRAVQKVGHWRTTRMASLYADKMVACSLEELTRLISQMEAGEPLKALTVRELLNR